MSSVDLAAKYVDRLIAREPGGVEEAMRRIEAKTGINYWTLWGFRYKRPKSIARDLFDQIRGAYLAICQRELRKLEHELSVETAAGDADDLSDLAREAEALAVRLRAAVAASRMN